MHGENQTRGLRFSHKKKAVQRVRIISTSVILCNVIFSYYNICKKDQSRYIYNSVYIAVMRLETGYIIINNAFIIHRSDVLRDATIQYIYIYIHFIYIYIYIYIFIYIYIYILLCNSFIYMFIYFHIYIFICIHIYIYILYLYLYILIIYTVFYTKVFTTLYITMYKNVTLSRPDVPTHAFVYRYNTFLNFVSNRIVMRAPREGSRWDTKNISTGTRFTFVFQFLDGIVKNH